MKQNHPQQGSMMLLVVVLMSILLVLCTRMWRSTAYSVDIAVQKQIHMQKKWAVQGILNCGIEACKIDFEALYARVEEQGGELTVPITSYAFDVPHVAHLTFLLTFKASKLNTLDLTAQILEDKKLIIQTSTIVSRTSIVA
ncbi:MAG: hypothetical protein AB7F19_07320 [Candidatus Babeliales bacterium]